VIGAPSQSLRRAARSCSFPAWPADDSQTRARG
jgi:hypothetical protein